MKPVRCSACFSHCSSTHKSMADRHSQHGGASLDSLLDGDTWLGWELWYLRREGADGNVWFLQLAAISCVVWRCLARSKTSLGRSWVQRLYWSLTWSCLEAFWVGCFAFPFSVWLQQVYLQCWGREGKPGNQNSKKRILILKEKIKAPQANCQRSPQISKICIWWGPCCCTFKAFSNSIFFFVITKLVLDLFVDF